MRYTIERAENVTIVLASKVKLEGKELALINAVKSSLSYESPFTVELQKIEGMARVNIDTDAIGEPLVFDVAKLIREVSRWLGLPAEEIAVSVRSSL